MTKFKVVPFVISLLFFIFNINNVNALYLYDKDNNLITLNSNVNSIAINSGDKNNDGNLNLLNFVLKGETHVTNNFITYGKWQYKFMNQINDSKLFKNLDNTIDLAIVGMKYGNLGYLNYGRNKTLMSNLLTADKSFHVLNIINNSNINASGYGSDSVSGLVTYHNKDFFGTIKGLNFNIQYHGKNNFTLNNRTSALKANGSGYSFSASYEKDDLTLSSAYSSINRAPEQNTLRYGRGDIAKLWATSMQYNFHPVYLSAFYSENYLATPIENGFANKTKNVEFIAQFKLLNGFLRPAISYGHSQGQEIDKGVDSIDLNKYISFGSTYDVTNNVTVYGEYKLNLLQKENTVSDIKLNLSKDNVAAFGVNYKF